MTDDSDAAQKAYGEALYASLCLEAVIVALLGKGLLTPAELRPLIDQALLFVENLRGSRGGSHQAIDHARHRIENLLKRHLTLPPSE